MIRSNANYRNLVLTFRDSTAVFNFAFVRCALAVVLVACGGSTDVGPPNADEVGDGAAASGGGSTAGNGGAVQGGTGGTTSAGGAAPSGGAAGKGISGGAGADASGSGGASAGASGAEGASASGTGGTSAGASGSGGGTNVMCPPILDPTPISCVPGGSGVGTKCSEPDTACYFVDGSSGNPPGGSGGSQGSGAAGGNGGTTPVVCLPASDPLLLDLLPNYPFLCGSSVSEVKGPPVCRSFTAGNGHGPSPACCYKVKYVGVCA